MKITLKTKNLTIKKFRGKYDAIIIPINLYLEDNILSQMNYVLDKDFQGIKKDKALVWMCEMGGNEFVANVVIPLKDNLVD